MVDSLTHLGNQGVLAARAISHHTEPLVRESAAQWRHAVDEHIGPGLKAGVGHLAVGILGEERKKSVDETMTAIKTIAEHVMNDEEDTARADVDDFLYNPTNTHHGVFHYERDPQSGDGYFEHIPQEPVYQEREAYYDYDQEYMRTAESGQYVVDNPEAVQYYPVDSPESEQYYAVDNPESGQYYSANPEEDYYYTYLEHEVVPEYSNVDFRTNHHDHEYYQRMFED